MSFEQDLVRRLAALEREIERLKTREAAAGVDPSGHKHSQLWESDGGAVALATDAAGASILQSTQPLKAQSSNFPNMGTTTLAEKLGHIYLGTGKDIYPDNDNNPLWSRSINLGTTPTEHWHQGADDIAWTGWASYAGFVTPSSITRTNSCLSVANTTQARWFYYRPYVNAQTNLVARCWANYRSEAGLMVDDGVDHGDNLGAKGFYRITFNVGTTLGGMAQIVTEYRQNGVVPTSTSFFTSLPPHRFVGLLLAYGFGSRWSAWGGGAYLIDEAGVANSQLFQFPGSIWGWTPARIGLYGRCLDAAGGTDKRSLWDLYKE